MEGKIVRVRIELDFVDGKHFNFANRDLPNDLLKEEAKKSMFGFIDSFFRKDADAKELYDWMQAFVLEH